jgi:aquaporin Z
MLNSIRTNWPEYLIEGFGLGVFMTSACVFSVLLFHPNSTLLQIVPSAFYRRVLMGLAMGFTAIAIIYSPLGKRSGAHINPATTITFFRLRKIKSEDAFLYIFAQFVGATSGVLLSALFLGKQLADPAVNYAVTLPGQDGIPAAFIGEAGITFLLMSAVLVISNNNSIARYTGIAVGLLVALYITFEASISGMSMNPARTFGSAFSARNWQSIWLYFIAPLAGMLAAAELYMMTHGKSRVVCAKLHHQNSQRCIFNCGYGEAVGKQEDT